MLAMLPIRPKLYNKSKKQADMQFPCMEVLQWEILSTILQLLTCFENQGIVMDCTDESSILVVWIAYYMEYATLQLSQAYIN